VKLVLLGESKDRQAIVCLSRRRLGDVNDVRGSRLDLPRFIALLRQQQPAGHGTHRRNDV
jgi:hypothetical protein